MIEELKMVLDTIGDLSGIGLWVIGGFIAFKLIMYLSTTGSIVYIIKLLVERIYTWSITPKPPALTSFTKDDIYSLCITSDDTRDIIMECLKSIRQTSTRIETGYIHRGDALWLEDAIKEKKALQSKGKSIKE